MTPVLDGHEEHADGVEEPLSKESEREILEMVEDQLDRPNPPDTKVLYRRAMHFVDRGVRHLNLQQFNAKFPLQVKRRRSRDRPEAPGGSPPGRSGPSGNGTSAGSTGNRKERDDGSRPQAETEEQREVVREGLLDFARAVAGAGDRGEVIDVLTDVDDYVDRVVKEL